MVQSRRPAAGGSAADHALPGALATVIVAGMVGWTKPWTLAARVLMIGAVFGAVAVAYGAVASACGGFFCQNDPVDQIGERIVFSVNDDATITSLIEIQYTGTADDFSWILPIPEAIPADALAVPADGDLVFDELHSLTDVRFIAPVEPECLGDVVFAGAIDDDGGVEVFASGEVGPFGFDVIGSEDPEALIGWLRDNNYRVDPVMELFLDVYVEEQFAFIAMRLLDGETSDSITPIEVTYSGLEPMIPLRLTAVAAADDMPIWVWIIADGQAVPSNYEHMEIATAELTFFPGGNNYQRLVGGRADALGGRAFITEFAGPMDSLDLSHPYLRAPQHQGRYLTRLATVISPLEMTVDPTFSIAAELPDVSNVRDASELAGLYDCERNGGDEGSLTASGVDSDALEPIDDSGAVSAMTPAIAETGGGGYNSWVPLIIVAAAVAGALLILLVWRLRRRMTVW